MVRIRPQRSSEEPIADLIEDPWRVLPCQGDAAGCTVRFSDPDFALAGRDTVYYVRAIEPESPVVNAANLRCERDAAGRCVSLRPCDANEVPPEDDCLAPSEQRAWSSPIFVDYGRPESIPLNLVEP